jgi:DNA polymerase-4
MDAFYASVEQRNDPQLRGKRVIVAWRGKRSVVCAASYEARSFRGRSAMPTVHAERLCPNAILVAPDFSRYRAVSRSVREIFKRHTDLIEPLSNLWKSRWWQNSWQSVLRNVPKEVTSLRTAVHIQTRISSVSGV